MPAYITTDEFLTLAGGPARFQEIADAEDLESYLQTVLDGAEARLTAGIERAGYAVPIVMADVAEDLRDGLRSMLGQFVAGLAAQTVGGPDHLKPIGEEALSWLKSLQKRESSIPGVERPEASVTRRPRVFKVTTGERQIPRELFDGMGRIGGAR